MASRRRKGKRGTARAGVTEPGGFRSLSKTGSDPLSAGPLRLQLAKIARAGRKVYERHRTDFERRHRNKYVLIDIRTEKIFVAESPEDAYRQAAAERDEGPFHLVRVGERAAFRSRRLSNGDATRITR